MDEKLNKRTQAESQQMIADLTEYFEAKTIEFANHFDAVLVKTDPVNDVPEPVKKIQQKVKNDISRGHFRLGHSAWCRCESCCRRRG